MFTEEEIEVMKSLGLDCDFNHLPGDNPYWDVIDEVVKDELMYDGFNEKYEPTKTGVLCEGLIDKIYAIKGKALT